MIIENFCRLGGITIKIEEILDKVIKICILHSAKSVYLFGSRAKGTFRERSDIDIAVSGADDMEMLKEEIEALPTLYTVDVVDLDTCGNELLMEDIREYGRKIYEKV